MNFLSLTPQFPSLSLNSSFRIDIRDHHNLLSSNQISNTTFDVLYSLLRLCVVEADQRALDDFYHQMRERPVEVIKPHFESMADLIRKKVDLHSVEDISRDETFWNQFLCVLAYLIAHMGKRTVLKRSSESTLRCIEGDDKTVVEWNPAQRGWDLYLASTDYPKGDIFMTHPLPSNSGGNQKIYYGRNLDGNRVVVKVSHHCYANIQSLTNGILFCLKDSLPYTAPICGMSLENVYVEEEQDYRSKTILIEKWSGWDLHTQWFWIKTAPIQYKIHLSRGIIEAVAKLHEQGVYHGDLSLRNLLIDEEGQIFHTDLGIYFARLKGHRLSGDYLFQPLEMKSYLSQAPIDDESVFAEKCDSWALGIILMMILGENTVGMPVYVRDFIMNNRFDMLTQEAVDAYLSMVFTHLNGTLKDNFPERVFWEALVHCLLQVDPYKRVSATYALSWVNKMYNP